MFTSRLSRRKAFLDSLGTPSLLRTDLRTSFLSFFSQTNYYPIRRYEFGPTFLKKKNHGVDTVCVQACSIDNVWVQK